MNFIKLQEELINLNNVNKIEKNNRDTIIRITFTNDKKHDFFIGKEKMKKVFKNLEKTIKPIDIENLL